MNSDRIQSEPKKPEIENLLMHETTAIARDMFRIFTENANQDGVGSFTDVATAMVVDKRIVAREVRNLDKKFNAITGGKLIERSGLQYKLTPAGRLIGEELITHHYLLVETVQRASKQHKEARLAVTENLLPALTRLKIRLRRDARIELYPDPRRSADLLPPDYRRDESRSKPRKFVYAMYSMCADATELIEGRLGPVPGEDMEVAVIKIDPFRIMAETSIYGDASELAMAEVWDQCQLVVPDGGAVRTFLTAVETGWEAKRGYTEATDYSFCKACLVNNSVPNPAMIVHGNRTPVPGYALYDIADHPELQAVTGVFRRIGLSSSLGSQKKAIWDRVWEAAIAEFSPTERKTSGAA